METVEEDWLFSGVLRGDVIGPWWGSFLLRRGILTGHVEVMDTEHSPTLKPIFLGSNRPLSRYSRTIPYMTCVVNVKTVPYALDGLGMELCTVKIGGQSKLN
uniref:(northern house mosquito) hypothetical protein n=1 Tax=Culex pipiens TaxID=7175 RepID=A0A8D8CGG1_CULPI